MLITEGRSAPQKRNSAAGGDGRVRSYGGISDLFQRIKIHTVLGHIREHKVQIGRPLYEGLGRFAPLVNGTLLGVLELGTSL